MNAAPRVQQAKETPRIFPGVIKFFVLYCRNYIRRHFHSLRMLQGGCSHITAGRPLVIYLNHASWWDPLVCLLLSREILNGCASYAPMDSAMLKRYGFFKHLGFFPVQPGTIGGARQFLRTAHTILASSRNALWLTPQGRFMDVRERPLRLMDGLGTLAALEPGTAFIPLAIEYTFWTELRPEILVSFGEPIIPAAETARSATEWTRTFTDALESTQDELAARSCRREPHDWVTLDRGQSGINGIYDTWRRLRALIRGEKFVSEHHPETPR